jgi:thioredoxin reductase (NADPH)
VHTSLGADYRFGEVLVKEERLSLLNMSVRDLVIVGAGPSGLSAAIAAKQRDLDYQVLEQGVLVNSIYRFPPQMVFFTTPELLEIGGLPFVSPYEKPTRAEALNYYRKVAEKYDLQIAYGETVLSVQREDDVFALATRTSCPSASSGHPEPVEGWGVERVRYARNVLMAIGYYDHPNLIGVPGEDLPHVHHYYSEPHAYFRQRVVIVGGGNSAAEAALECFRAGARVTLVHRWPELKASIKYWVKPDIENRIKEGSVAARFNTCVTAVKPTFVVVRTAGSNRDEELPADAVLLLTGYRSDSNLLRAAGVHLNERCVPAFNPETLETNVPGLFLAGGAVTGMDTSNIFIENGRFHGEKIAQVIAERANRL